MLSTHAGRSGCGGGGEVAGLVEVALAREATANIYFRVAHMFTLLASP